MSYTKEIVCLANSRKSQAHCVAGKEVREGKFGGWVRPVGSASGGELPTTDICYQNEQIPAPLDVIRVSIKRRVPHKYQTENHLIDTDACWEHVGRIDVSKLAAMSDKVAKLWIDGFNSANGINDRIPLEKAGKISSSLLLIKPTSLTIHKEYEFASKSWKIRADFRFMRTRYCLVVTDPRIEDQYHKKKAGDYPVENSDAYLTVSLGEPYKGFCYKLVAAIMLVPRK